jgi:hypothetical protein
VEKILRDYPGDVAAEMNFALITDYRKTISVLFFLIRKAPIEKCNAPKNQEATIIEPSITRPCHTDQKEIGNV